MKKILLIILLIVFLGGLFLIGWYFGPNLSPTSTTPTPIVSQTPTESVILDTGSQLESGSIQTGVVDTDTGIVTTTTGIVSSGEIALSGSVTELTTNDNIFEQLKNKHTHLGGEIIVNGGINQTTHSLTFSLSGTVGQVAESITVMAYDQSGKLLDSHKLGQFKLGQTNWSYNVKPEFGNLSKGTTYYVVLSDNKDMGDSSVIITMTMPADSVFDNNKKYLEKQKEFCLLDVCVKPNDDAVSNRKDFIFKVIGLGEMEAQYYIVLKIGNYWIKYEGGDRCGGGGYNKTVYDLNGKKLTLENFPNIPKTLEFGSIILKNPSIDFQVGLQHNIYLDYETKNRLLYRDKEISKEISLESAYNFLSQGGGSQSYYDGIQLSEFLKSVGKTNNKILFPTVTLNVDGIEVQYNVETSGLSKTEISYESHYGNVYLLTPKINPEHTEKIVYALKDLKKTKELVASMIESDESLVLMDKQDNEMEDIKSNWLPVLGTFPINSEFDLVLAVRGHKFQSMAEFCKPAIYVYDQHNRNQAVSIKFNTLGYFTHLDPALNIKNGWNFTANNGKVDVDSKTFDYLYYAVKVGNYTFSNDGRHVQGKDINTFFNDKLPKMGFNAKEQADFMEYRKEKFTPEKNYIISFRFNEEIDKYVSLDFSLNPTQVNRVLLEAREIEKTNPLYEYQNIKNNFDSQLLRKAKRGGELDIFERGGIYMDINKNISTY